MIYTTTNPMIRNRAGRIIRKIGMALSLIAVVSLGLASSGLAQGTPLTHDHASPLAACPDAGDENHGDSSAPVHESCGLHACPYSFRSGVTVPPLFHVTRLDFVHPQQDLRSIEPILFKRPPRDIL